MNSSTKILTDLHEEFNDVIFDFQEINYEGKLPCFFISVKNEMMLSEIWMKVSNIIAVNYQATLINEFSIWNIYLFFISKEYISNELKYQIENDTFSSRKIVIEGNYDYTKIIKEHILNNDITINSISISKKKFKPNPLIYNQLEELEAKTRVTDKMKDAYAQIVDRIKENANEI